jgi:heme ABC exporter ATP-binding subunit CcmA
VSVVSIRNVVVLLGPFPALAGATLDVNPGESVLLQGPNGAGKSTLLRLCAGLHRADTGEGQILGHDLHTERRAIRRRVGLVGHKTMLYDDLTVQENLRFWARAVGATDGELDSAVERMRIDARLMDVPTRQLSAGQRRRTALAVAAARRPELWLLDEPHAGLDQAGRDVVDDLIRDATAAGATVLVASHELDRVRPVVDRQVTIAGGLVMEEAHAG